MALLGWIPGIESHKIESKSQPRFLHNASGRFESRYVSVQIQENSPSIMLKNMGKSTIGVWVAHGEGQGRIFTLLFTFFHLFVKHPLHASN